MGKKRKGLPFVEATLRVVNISTSDPDDYWLRVDVCDLEGNEVDSFEVKSAVDLPSDVERWVRRSLVPAIELSTYS